MVPFSLTDDVEVIAPVYFHGTLRAPSSKSYLQRAIAIASFCEYPCTIENFFPSSDALAALGIARELGALVSHHGACVRVQKGSTNSNDVRIHCGESGLSTRMFSPIAATFNRKTRVVGEGSLLGRPIDMIEHALNQLGAATSSENGYLPLDICGPLVANDIEIDGSESSQLLTGLLIALPVVCGDSVIHVKNLKSIPYVQMTLDILTHFHIEVTHQNYNTFYIQGGQKPAAENYFIEGDWSGASFHLVGAAISGQIVVTGLNRYSSQADVAILQVLKACGAGVELDDSWVRITKKELNAFSFDATHCPDLFPPLAVLAACCEGTSEIKGLSRLKHKESDRARTITEEFRKLNIDVSCQGDVMYIGKSNVHGGTVSSRNDHRIAMALSILAAVADGDIVVEGSQAVNKSYPDFFEQLSSVTFQRH